jgi:hypothetical protein
MTEKHKDVAIGTVNPRRNNSKLRNPKLFLQFLSALLELIYVVQSLAKLFSTDRPHAVQQKEW